MEAHGRTRGASSPATDDRRPRLVGGEKPWSRRLRRAHARRTPVPRASVRGTPATTDPRVGTGRGRLRHALSEQILVSAAEPRAPRCPGRRSRQAEGSHLGGSPSEPGRHDRDASRERSRRGWSGSSREDERALARTIPESWPPPEHNAPGTAVQTRREQRGPPRETPRSAPAPSRGNEAGASRTGTRSQTREGRGPGPARASDSRAAAPEPSASAARGRGREPEARGHASISAEGPQLERAGASAPTSESASARRAEQPPGAAERGGHLVQATRRARDDSGQNERRAEPSPRTRDAAASQEQRQTGPSPQQVRHHPVTPVTGCSRA